MNINSVFRSMMGEPLVSEVKVVELKPGQIVRGVVQENLGNQEALVSINGVSVRAKLETPLQPGEATMLQVQGESSSGQIILKPVAISVSGTSDVAFAEILKSFGLKDTPANRDMILQMQSAGVPITKENVNKFAEMLGAKPSNVEAKQWIQAMAVANARGLPMSTGVLQALTEVMAEGNPLTDRLAGLEKEIRTVLQTQSATLPEQTRAGLNKVLQILQQLSQLGPEQGSQLVKEGQRSQVGNGGGQILTTASSSATTAPVVAGTTQGQTTGQTAVPVVPVTGTLASEASSGRVPTSAGGTSTPAGTSPAPSIAAQGQAQATTATPVATSTAAAATGGASATSGPLGVTAPQAAAAQATAAATEPARTAAGKDAPAAAQPAPSGALGGASATQAAAVASPVASPVAAEPSGNWIGNALKLLGVDHEQLLAKSTVSNPNMQAVATTLIKADELSLDFVRQGKDFIPNSALIDHAQQLPGDSLKSLLMALSKSDDLPPMLKDAMSATAQQITGQQLLLSAERNSPLTHLTLFIPFTNGDGQQTASVHIQSRKKGRETLDPSNCRLLFDLQMSAMGDTLVDVQVINSIVSLQIHNDHPAIPELLEASREEITSSLQAMGYQFMSMKCKPFPDLIKEKESNSSSFGTELTRDPQAFYQPKPYKGVDLRV